LVGSFIGLLIVQNNQYLLFFSFFLSVRLLVFTRPTTSLYVILISVFFLDWLRDMGLISDQFTMLTDVILVMLIIKVFFLKWKSREIIRTPIDLPFSLFIVLGLVSTLLNSQYLVTTIVGFRFDLKYALMFYLIVQLNPSIRFFKHIFYLLMVLLIIQVPVAMVKYTIYGQGEEAIGTYAFHTGILSTIIPLIAICIFIGFYFYNKTSIFYIIGCLLFFLFSIIGGKRGFIFFAIALSLFLAWQAGFKNIMKIYVLVPFFIVGLLMTIYLVPDLRPALEDPSHLINFSVSYETMHSKQDGAAAGRSAAFKKTNEIVLKSVQSALVGFGPGSISQSFFKKYKGRLEDKIPIIYGRSQFVTMCLETGYIGVILFLWGIVSFFKIAQTVFLNTQDKFWKSLAFGFKGIVFTFLICMNYGVLFRMDVSAFIFWFLAAAVFCYGKQSQLF
jgi:hypothetical protein